MDKLRECPMCGSELKVHGPEDWKPTYSDPDSGGDPYSAHCDCGFEFSVGHCDWSEFVKACNRRPEPENKPLSAHTATINLTRSHHPAKTVITIRIVLGAEGKFMSWKVLNIRRRR